MTQPDYLPVFELTRGNQVESVHFGAIAVVDLYGRLVAHYGNPKTVTFLRSSAKPFQLLPFLERGGKSYYGLNQTEIAVMCASHSGTDMHVAVIQGIQSRAGFGEDALQCGVHMPGDEATAEALQQRGEQPTPNRHNCSGKHTGMLAYAQMTGRRYPDLSYLSPQHPIQQEILCTFAEMSALPQDEVELGTDGCSAPNFAIPLYNAAYAYARLCDPEAGQVGPPERASACHQVTGAMMHSPEMIAGPGKFDTRLMQVTRNKLVSKGGAEGYQGIGVMAGVLAPGAPAIGIAFKISDGDERGKIRSAVALEILRQLGVLSQNELLELKNFGPVFEVRNWRELLVGQGRPDFILEHDS
jgi:L-asparaginase II